LCGSGAVPGVVPGTAKIYIPSSRSMEPFLYPDDTFLVSNSTSFNELSIGDVIVFRKPSDISKIIVARIVDIQTDSFGQRG
jgi:signal peptidase I